MESGNPDNYYPHTLKVDEMVKNEQEKNFKMNDIQNERKLGIKDIKNDYLCIFENNGQEFPEIALGLKYKNAKSLAERKDACESKQRNADGAEKLMFIKRDDWINPNDVEYECGGFNISDNKRAKYDKTFTGDPLKFPSKKLCDLYNDKNQEFKIYSKMVSSKIDTPAIDLRVNEIDDKYKNETKSQIFWFIYLIALIFFIFWTLKYNVQKPYAFYDYVQAVFVNKAIVLIIIFGIFIYLWCPFDTCYHNNDTPLYRRDFNRFMKESVCEYTNNNISYLEDNICKKYDNSSWLSYFDIFINLLFKFNRKLEIPLKYANNQMCSYCDVSYPCIDRQSYNTLYISKPPKIITVFSNDLKNDSNQQIKNYALQGNYLYAINLKYKYLKKNNVYVPYDSGTIIYLRTDDDMDKVLLMSCLKLNDGTHNKNITLLDYENTLLMMDQGIEFKKTLENIDKKINVLDSPLNIGQNYSYSWIYVKDRKGYTKFNQNIDKLRIKSCPNSHRIFSVAGNYELLGYNIPLTEEEFINSFERNNHFYLEYPYFPTFDLEKLNTYIKFLIEIDENGKADQTEEPEWAFFEKPEFVKRKLISIYNYLTQHPSHKLRTKNVTVLNGNILHYDNIDKKLNITEKQQNALVKNSEHINFGYNNILRLNELNNYHNDDEDDDEYLSYYNEKHAVVAKNFYLTANYKLDIDLILNKLKIEDNGNLSELMYKLNLELYNLNYVQRKKVRENISNKIMERYNFLQQVSSENNLDVYTQQQYLYNLKNVIIPLNNNIIKFNDNEFNVECLREFKYMEIVNQHNFQTKNYIKDGEITQCIFCKQFCKL